MKEIPGTQYKIIDLSFFPMGLSFRFFSGVVFPTTPQVYQCADDSQEACRFVHADGVPDVFSPEVRL